MKTLLVALCLLLAPLSSSADALKLAWDAVTTDTAGNTITGVKYNLYRSANGGNWKLVATREGTNYTWYFPVLGHYVYRVTAFNQAGESLPSNELKIWIDGQPKCDKPQPVAQNEIAVQIDSKVKQE